MSSSSPVIEKRARLRDLGIQIGRLPTGRWNAITDVPGVKVGHTTLISGDGPLVVGQGPVRTGVTVVLPNDDIKNEPIYAGVHVLNGFGEMTGTLFLKDAGIMDSPVGLTNTSSVGAVYAALIETGISGGLPVVAETFDGYLNDIHGMHVRSEHVRAALESASSGPVPEGSVGGGTGMICHGFKGGIGTASRVVPVEKGGWVVGALVQANYGSRHELRVNGVPVGEEITPDEVADAWVIVTPPSAPSSSIIVVIATDAPLIPSQCRRLAQRATIGVGRVGGLGADTSGDIFLAFSTANRGQIAPPRRITWPAEPITVQALPFGALHPLYEAAIDATEEAILNALCMATTMTGANGHTAQAIPLDRLQEIMTKYKRSLE